MKTGKTASGMLLVLLIVGVLSQGFLVVSVQASDTIVDTHGDSRFTKYGGSYWISVQDHDVFHTRAYNNNFWFTLCGEEGHGEPLYFGLWQASLPQSGAYEVFVWIPNPDAFVYDGRTYTPTQSAEYQIYHRDGMATIIVNQRLRTGSFYSLGTFNFDTSASIILNDRTGEPYLSTMIAFDAVKFVAIAPPTPTVHLESRKNDGSTSNLGTITFDSVSYGLPVDISKASGTYQATYYPVSGHEIDHWETSGGVSVPDPYAGQSTNVYVSGSGTLKAIYKNVSSPTYDVTINAYCNTEGVNIVVPFTMDGTSTSFSTPHTFIGLTGGHTFRVPSSDGNGHPFVQWSTSQATTTITVTSGGTCTAYYQARAILIVPDVYPTIQAAVNAASPGDTIIVKSGTYTENVYVDVDHLTIKSESGTGVTTVIAANTLMNVFYVKADLVNIQGFTTSGDNIGIALHNSQFCDISDNICHNDRGVVLYNYSSNNAVKNNICSGNGYVGIQLGFNCSNNIIENNTCSENLVRGIELLESSNNNIIRNNTCSGNGETGILLARTQDNVICENIITENHQCGVRDGDSSGNKFYHNDFIDNPRQFGWCDKPTRLIWDDGYPSGGNYWSDYADVDLNNDGIWDHPYVIDENNQDNYPLVNPWTEPSGYGRPVLVSAMKISRIEDTLTAEFKIQNRGNASIRLDKLLVGGRFNWGTLTSGDFPDFPSVSVTLMPDESYEYKGTMELTEVGNYQFFVAYYIENPSEQEKKLLDQNNWNTCIDLAEGLTDRDRSISLEKWPVAAISSSLTITPSGPYRTGDLLIATFGIKNTGSVPVSFDVLTVGGRNPDGLPVDFDWERSMTIEPGDEHIYIGTIHLPDKEGNYHFFCAYRALDGSWNTCIDLGEGLTDNDRVKDLSLIGTKYDYPLGGIVIPEADFPEGEGRAIPIYIPTVVDDSNVIREEDGWQTAKTLVKADWSFDWSAVAAGLSASGAEVWDPMQNKYVPSPEGSAFSVVAGVLQAFSSAQSVASICITIQSNSQGSYRAILQVSDPEAKSLFRTYAVQGMVSIVPGQLPVNMEDALSDGIAGYFKLPAAKFFETYLETLYIDKAHKNEEYNGYLSLSKDNRIELTPRIYKGDALGFDLWKENLIIFFSTSQEVARLKGQAFVDFEKCIATIAESKLVQKALAPIALVPESAIVLNGGSPCEFRICDSQGRVTGLVNGETHEEIPHSMYLSDSNTIIVYGPSEDLHYEVVGTDAGTYKLYVTCVRGWNVTTFIASNIPIASQAIHQYSVDWAALSRGEEGVAAQVDSNGDGVFEHTFVSDSELTQSELLANTILLGDLNLDGIVNILDAIQAASAFGSHAGHPKWNEQADINRDGVVNILDVIILANNFGEH